MKHRLAAQSANACLVQNPLVLLHARGLALFGERVGHAPAFDAIGVIDRCHSLKESLAIAVRHTREHAAVGSDRFQQLDRLVEARTEFSCRRACAGHASA